jgi:hypothetical protein
MPPGWPARFMAVGVAARTLDNGESICELTAAHVNGFTTRNAPNQRKC